MTRSSTTLVTLALWSVTCGIAGCCETDPRYPVTPTRELRVIASENVGTSPFLDALGVSPHRQVCTEWYDNNLCTLDAEGEVAAVVETDRPDVLMLQEVWDQRRCDESNRPSDVGQEPYACAGGEEHQLERVLPSGYRYACASEYPDNCIAFLPEVFVPGTDDRLAEHQERDASVAMRTVDAECGPPGRIAWLRGRTTLGPTVLVVVHASAGIGEQDAQCRGQQLAALRAELKGVPKDEAIVVAGDFNIDPLTAQGADADELAALVDELSLLRLADDGATHRLLQEDLDLVWARGWPPAADAICTVIFPDQADAAPMFDHGYLGCR